MHVCWSHGNIPAFNELRQQSLLTCHDLAFPQLQASKVFCEEFARQSVQKHFPAQHVPRHDPSHSQDRALGVSPLLASAKNVNIANLIPKKREVLLA